jgi:hypothetical protein
MSMSFNRNDFNHTSRMLGFKECVFFFMDQFRKSCINNLHYYRKLIETLRLFDTGEICALTGVFVITEVTQNTQNTVYVFLHI